MSLEKKFDAAVNLIRSLPQNGLYEPSKETKLRFYGLYKQATSGPCKRDKPGFWDVISRTKWEYWNKLGDMPTEEAMRLYVDELYTHIGTMKFDSDIRTFLAVEADGFPMADLELIASDLLPMRRPNSEKNSPQNSPQHSPIYSRSVSSASSHAPDASDLNYPIETRTRHDSDDEFIDTVDVTVNETEPVQMHRLSNGSAHQITSQLTHLRVLEQLPGALARLEADVAALRKAVEGDRRILDQVAPCGGWRWPWQELSAPTLLLLAAWPFVAFRIAARLQRRRT